MGIVFWMGYFLRRASSELGAFRNRVVNDGGTFEGDDCLASLISAMKEINVP